MPLCSTCQTEITDKNRVSRGKNCFRKICKPCRNQETVLEKASLKAEVFAAYGDKCVCCGETHRVFLNIDDIDNSGGEHRRAAGDKARGCGLYRSLRQAGYPKDNYQILCFNCNFAKHVLGACPHQDGI